MKHGRSTVKEWFPFYIDKWIFGSTRIELIIKEDERCLDLRGIWLDLLSLSKKDHGYIRANEVTPYHHGQLAALCNVPVEYLEKTISICLEVGKLSEPSAGIYYVCSHEEFELSDRHKRRMSENGDTYAEKGVARGEESREEEKRENNPPTPLAGGDRASSLNAHLQSLGVNAESLLPIWERWIRCKQGKKFKNLESEKAGVSHLVKLCGKDTELASQIVEQSMANNWQGLFPLKASTANGGIKMSVSLSPQSLDSLDIPDYYSCGKCYRRVKLTKRLYKGSTMERYGQCPECFDKPETIDES